jgi:hypothetical protein
LKDLFVLVAEIWLLAEECIVFDLIGTVPASALLFLCNKRNSQSAGIVSGCYGGVRVVCREYLQAVQLFFIASPN